MRRSIARSRSGTSVSLTGIAIGRTSPSSREADLPPQELRLEIGRGHARVQWIDRPLEISMTQSCDVLIDAAWRKREDPAFRGGEEIGNEVPDLYDRQVVALRIETERVKIANEVVRLAAGREDRANAARLHDRDVAADRIAANDPAD